MLSPTLGPDRTCITYARDKTLQRLRLLCVLEVRGHGPSMGAPLSVTLDSVAENKIKLLPIKETQGRGLVICGHLSLNLKSCKNSLVVHQDFHQANRGRWMKGRGVSEGRPHGLDYMNLSKIYLGSHQRILYGILPHVKHCICWRYFWFIASSAY